MTQNVVEQIDQEPSESRAAMPGPFKACGHEVRARAGGSCV